MSRSDNGTMNVVEVVKARMSVLSIGREISVEDDYMDTEVGTRGLIRLLDRRGEVIRLEFIEPEEVWADPDAVEEYGETMSEGVGVTVIVPDEERSDAESYLADLIGKGVEVLGYSEAITPRP